MSVGPDDFTSRLTTAGNAVGADKPQLAFSLASSDLSHSEIQAVGGFSRALQLATTQRLAKESGARLALSDQEKNALSAANEPVDDNEDGDSRNWLEKTLSAIGGVLSDTGSALVHNPVTENVLSGLEQGYRAMKYPFRLLSDAVDGGNDGEIDREMQADGYDKNSTTSYLAFMWSQGENLYHNLNAVRDTYGDDMVDQIIQYQRDPEQFMKDAEAGDPQAYADLQNKMDSAEWKKAADALDRRHISPGRDVAGLILGGHRDNAAFTALSGSLDAAFTWFTDPTLIVGKGLQAAHAIDVVSGDLARTGLARFSPSAGVAKAIDVARGGKQRTGIWQRTAGTEDQAPGYMIDQAGVDKLLEVDENGKAIYDAGKGWQSLIDDSAKLREADARSKTAETVEERNQAATEAAAIYRGMSNRYGPMMQFVDQINGARRLSEKVVADGTGVKPTVDALDTGAGHAVAFPENAKPIETLDEMREYLKSTNGLANFVTGHAALRVPVMPGRLSVAATRKWTTGLVKAKPVEDTVAAKRVRAQAKWLDYTKARELLPEDASDAEVAGTAQRLLTGKSAAVAAVQGKLPTALAIAKAKADRVFRRISTTLPQTEAINLTDGASARTVEQFGRIYMNKHDSARLAAAYTNGDLAQRRQILKGMIEQSFHAAGIAKTEDGAAYMRTFLGDLDGINAQQYGVGKTSEIVDQFGARRQVALLPSQLATHVYLPDMKTMHFIAAKFAVGGFARRSGISTIRSFGQSDAADSLLGAIKLGWITSAAGGLRNAIDEIGNFAAYGLGREVLAARSAFTQATKEIRRDRVLASRKFLDEVKANGGSKQAVLDRYAEEIEDSRKSLDVATRDLDRAHKHQLAVDNADAKAAEPINRARDRIAAADDAVRQAKLNLDTTAKSGAPAAELTPLQDQLSAALEEQKAAQAKHWEVMNDRHKKTGDDIRAELDAIRQRDGILSIADAEAGVKRAEAHRLETQKLENVIKHRVPLWARNAADHINDLFAGVVLGQMVRVFGKDFAVTKERVDIARELADREFTRTIRDGVFQSHYIDSGLLRGDSQAEALHRAGLMARKYAFAVKHKGWGEIEADGGTGLDAWAKMLHLAFGDETSPAHAWLDTVKRMHNTQGPEADLSYVLESAKSAIAQRMHDPDMAHFLHNAEVFKQLRNGTQVTKESPKELQDQAIEEYAERLSEHLASTLFRDGKIHPELLDMLAESQLTGVVPDSSWLSRIPSDERPKAVIGQLWAPYNPAHEPGGLARGYTQMMSKAYSKVVTDQINALSRNPLVAALYYNARRNTYHYRDFLVNEAGWDGASANEVTKRLALQHAEAEALKHVDNPYISTQASLIYRNYASFIRAQEDWLRRWGRTAKDNPQLIEQANLLIHGATTTGLVEQNDQGEWVFVYPGSRQALGFLNSVFGVNGMPGGAQLPLVGELTSQLTFVNPSLDNPLGVSATPLISIPFKALTMFAGPDYALSSSYLDEIVNGKLGAGREWYEQLLPSWANKIMAPFIGHEDPASKYAAAYAATLANLQAAGITDDPRLQTATGKAAFNHALQVGVRNSLVMNSLFGLWAPAAPAVELEAAGTKDVVDPVTGETTTSQGNRADWSAHKMGIRSLKDEARKLISDVGYEKALQLWTAAHPNELIYVQGARTQGTSPSATTPATVAAARAIEQHGEFFAKYGGPGGVAAYLLPQGKAGTPDGEFSQVAYQAELEAGIRDYKSLDDYFNDVITMRGARVYFDAKDKYDTARAEAHSQAARTRADTDWAVQKQAILNANPLLSERFSKFAVDNAGQERAIEALKQMVADGSASTTAALGRNRAGVAQLLEAYNTYQTELTNLGSRRGNAANAKRQSIKSEYETTVAQLAGATNSLYPELADMARGVFRLPE